MKDYTSVVLSFILGILAGIIISGLIYTDSKSQPTIEDRITNIENSISSNQQQIEELKKSKADSYFYKKGGE